MWLPDPEDFEDPMTPAEQRKGIRLIVLWCLAVAILLIIVFLQPGAPK